jgi:hypothetical protein
MYQLQNTTPTEMTTGNQSVPANGNHRQKKTKRAAKVNVVTAHCSLALDAQVLITTDIMRRLKPKNIALEPAQKLNLTNDSNTTLHGHVTHGHCSRSLYSPSLRQCNSRSPFKLLFLCNSHCATRNLLYPLCGNRQMCLTTRLRYIEPEAILVDRCR